MRAPEAKGVLPDMALQMLRAKRPARAKKGARRSEYLAGLKQAEQLWSASSTIGPDARPILLFYGLAQAARALCVAGLDGDAWKAPGSHGLECIVDEPADGEELDLSRVRIRPTGDSLVERTARVLDSPVLEQEATLSELIASLDTTFYFDHDVVIETQPVAVVSDWSGAEGPLDNTHVQKLIIGPVPGAFSDPREVVSASPNNLEYQRIVDPDLEAFSSWLAKYPTLEKLGTPTNVKISQSLRNDGEILNEYDAYVEWGDGASETGEDQLEWTQRYVDVLRHGTRLSTQFVDGVVFPRVGANTRALHPLVTWWLILFALSVLARYYPRIWSRVLDVDNSRLAVPMRHLLSEAEASIQRLVADALLKTVGQ